MNYRLSDTAKADLRDAFEFYELQRGGLGAEFLIDVGIGIARIVEAPRRWPEMSPGVRKYRIDRFPFGIFYQHAPQAKHIDIIGVIDLRRDPMVWPSA
jgi:plasmid stabilization system protein ParE